MFNRTIETVLPKLQAKIVGRKRFVITHMPTPHSVIYINSCAVSVMMHRGGYCFEMNSLFGALLKALGFHVTQLLCRVRINRKPEDRTPYTHLALAVAIGSTTYLCDVAFAGSQSIAPVLLGHDGQPQVLPEGRFRTTSQVGFHG